MYYAILPFCSELPVVYMLQQTYMMYMLYVKRLEGGKKKSKPSIWPRFEILTILIYKRFKRNITRKRPEMEPLLEVYHPTVLLLFNKLLIKTSI